MKKLKLIEKNKSTPYRNKKEDTNFIYPNNINALNVFWKFKIFYSFIHKRALRASLWFYLILTLILFLSGWHIMSVYEGDKIISFSTYIYWFVTTISTVGYGDISPDTTQGRSITIIIMLMGIGLFSIIAGSLINLIINLKQKILKGIYKIVKEEHILILGYNPKKTPQMINEIFADKKRTRKPIILITNNITENPFPNKIDFVYGDITNDKDLEKASIQTAKNILIIGKDDNETLTSCVVINNLTCEHAQIIAYVNDDIRAKHIQSISSKITVIISRMIEAMIQEMQDPGTYSLFTELLTNNKSQTCFQITVDNYNGDFEEITIKLKSKYDILPIALRSNIQKEPLENPPCNTPVTSGDILYVIAPYRPNNINWLSL